jgi:hypothetical protein
VKDVNTYDGTKDTRRKRSWRQNLEEIRKGMKRENETETNEIRGGRKKI